LSDITAANTEKTVLWGRGAKASLALALLIVAGDLLLWQVEPGINLAVMFAATAVPMVWLRRERINSPGFLVCAAIFGLSLLPLVEAASFLGFLSALFGVSLLALSASRRLPRLFEDLTGVLFRFGTLAPFRLLGDGLRLLAMGMGKGLGGRITRGVIVWIIPAGFALAFLLLFSSANPLIETALTAVRFDSAFDLLQFWRIVLWGVVGVIAWPLLRPRLLPWPKARQMQGPVRPKPENLLFGRAAILRSLIVFNALFAVQTVLDAMYLWGGVRLPDGLSYADYAHRGAYPLIVTALLAAAFVLAAMRRNGPAQQSVLIRRLVYLWIGQNVLLVVSSILRLDLYVQAYSLTEMRIAAGIWMGLVAVGLVLIVLRIGLGRSNKWLVTMNLASLGLTLFVCSFIDFSALIARFNVENSRELGGKGQPLDLYYMSSLGPTAIPAIIDYVDANPAISATLAGEFRMLAVNMGQAFLDRPGDWRSWTFRDQRLKDWMRGTTYFASYVPGARSTVPSP
jgi:hypothetical protein